jgi:hypothetical protein
MEDIDIMEAIETIVEEWAGGDLDDTEAIDAIGKFLKTERGTEWFANLK